MRHIIAFTGGLACVTDLIDIKDRLIAFARGLGIEAVGVTAAAPFDAEEEHLRRLVETGLECPFAAGGPLERCRPESLLPGARSIICAAVPYLRPFPRPDAADRRRVAPGWRGEVSRYAWGPDYHRVVREKLERLAAFLDEAAPGTAHRVMVDTTPLLERAAARRAGLGRIGKNCCLITPGYGSWVFLGEVVTTLDLPPDPPLPDPDPCGDCDLCLRACPTGALTAPGVLDHRCCLAYLTQAGEPIPREVRPALGRRVWGCDTCQAVCPHNRRLAGPPGAVDPVDLDQAPPPLLSLLAMTRARFLATFGTTAAAWRGPRPLRRNALVALGNTGRREAVPVLAAALAGPRADLRLHAAWALGRIGGGEARAALRSALARETDAAVREEIRLALRGGDDRRWSAGIARKCCKNGPKD